MTAALVGIATDEPYENIIDLLEAAIKGDLARDDEVMASRLLASNYRALAVEREDSYPNGPLFSNAVKNLEHAVKVDSEQGYGVFHDPKHIAVLPPFDLIYDNIAASIRDRRGIEAAVAYLEEKLSLFAGVPGNPMVAMLTQLGSAYYRYEEVQDNEKSLECYQKVLDSQPIEGSEHYEEAISGTKLHFTILGRIAKWKAARSKADTAMTCVLASFCCSPLAVVGLVLGILAIRDFKESVNQEGKGKALAAVAIGGGLILLCALMLIVAVIANLFK